MAKASAVTTVVAVCLSSLLSFAACAGEDDFCVKGKVYCDTCRVEFVTKLSEPISGATLRLECRQEEGTEALTYSQEARTDEKGEYQLRVTGDHSEEICDVRLVKSPEKDCRQLMRSQFEKARVVLTSKDGMADADRFVNPLGFMKKEPVPGCDDVLEELGLQYLIRDRHKHPR